MNKKRELASWNKLIVNIFNERPSEKIEIHDKTRILQILNDIGVSDAEHYTFMPFGGDGELSSAVKSFEDGKIELDFEGLINIVSPNTLTFHPIGTNPEWWYFRLNTLPFKATDVYENKPKDIETITEVEPKNYINSSFWDKGISGYNDNGEEVFLPNTARSVTRTIKGGDFIIFYKYSEYANNHDTYDIRHNNVNEEDFNRYIQSLAKVF